MGMQEPAPIADDRCEAKNLEDETDTAVLMLLFGMLAIVATVGLQGLVSAWCERDGCLNKHTWMTDQMRQLRQAEINCLVDPDPQFIDELLADPAASAAVRTVYLGGDLSDPRLERLRELPNLKGIVIIWANHQSEFLKRMHGSAAIEDLTLDCTKLVRADIDEIASLPHLKSLVIASESPFMTQQSGLQAGDLEVLRGNPTLERLKLIFAYPGIDAIRASLPRLKKTAAENASTGK